MDAEFSYEGKLEETPLPVLVAQVLDNKLSGMLHIDSADSKLWIYFDDGFPAGVHAPKSQVFLGSVLREMGIIDDAAYNESMMSMAKTGRLQGEILLEQGNLSEEQLDQALSLQLARKLARLFAIRSGEYNFVEDEELPAPMEPIRVNPYSLITNGIKNSYSENDLKRSLGVLVGKSCRLSEELASRLPLFEFSEEELQDVEVLKEYRSPQEFVRTATSGTTAAMMILLTLVSCKMLELDETSLAVPIAARVQPTGPAARKTAAPRPRPRPQEVVSPPRKPAAKPPPEARKPAQKKAGKVPADLLKRINEKYEELEQSDLWTILEVPRGSGADQIKKSFLVLTKIFHPDRIAEVEDQELINRMVSITGSLNEAFSTLSDPGRRLEYERQLSAGSDSEPSRTEDAHLQFKKALVFLKKKDLTQAAESLHWAVELEPKNADFQAYKIWVEFLQDRQGSEQDRARRALSKLVPVYKEDKSSFHSIKFLFMLFKRVDDDENYARFLALAHRSNPKDIDVAREMRLYNLRQEKEKRGLLGFMRKK